MDDAKTLEWRINRLEKQNKELEERIADLELQIGNLTERALRASCSSCSRY